MNAKEQPLISVIVPVYKVEKYLPACLDSLLAQTYQNFELLLVDDGSPDKCWEILQQYAAQDARVCIFRKLGKGTITYVGVDSHNGALEKDILKKLYVQLNIPVMDLPYGVTMEYRNGLGIVLNYSDQPYTFNLSKGAKALIGTTEIPTAGVFVFSVK